MSALDFLTLLFGLLLIVGAAGLAWWTERSRGAEARLWEKDVSTPRSSRLAHWLALAGYEGEDAVRRFSVRQGIALFLGVAIAWAWGASAMATGLQWQARTIPVFGTALSYFVAFAPVLVALGIASVPALRVRAARRERVASLERDLPPALETLATLAESGMGFEAALERYVSATPDRPLVREFARVQNEIRAGENRSTAMRRQATRTEVDAIRSFVSAWIQAEEAGAGLVEIVRNIADDLARRARERALARAEALPEKLVFPLVSGFLPGILVWTLGPAIHRLITLIDAIMATPR